MKFSPFLPGILGIRADDISVEYHFSAAFFFINGLPIPEIGDIAEFENRTIQICEFNPEHQVWTGIEI